MANKDPKLCSLIIIAWFLKGLARKIKISVCETLKHVLVAHRYQ